MMRELDHIVMGCQSLRDGVIQLSKTVGVNVPEGGKHPMMSTHNHLMALEKGSFFELIAIDEAAPTPDRVRWFTLDETATQDYLSAGPRPLCWVVKTDDLDRLVAESPYDHGEIVTLSRGDLTWRLTVPQDGSLLEGGLLPAFIEWPEGPHPSEAQTDLGVRLSRICLSHPDTQVMQAHLDALKIAHLAQVEEGPRGLRFEMLYQNEVIILD